MALALGCSDADDGNDSGANQGPGTGEPNAPADGGLGSGVMSGKGFSTQQFQSAAVSRNGVEYILITNGWGSGFRSHEISWEGTSFLVESTDGTTGTNWQPASFPTVFCGRYSVPEVPSCGLPVPIESAGALRTGWRWAPNGNAGQYNASYDIWVGDGTNLQGYLMVWLRDPPGPQPAGRPDMSHQQVTVQGLPGLWNIWTGSVHNIPIINWVRAEGQDVYELEFDVMDLVRDARNRGLNVPGTHINAVAVGFEIWEGPITNLESVDFYVDVN